MLCLFHFQVLIVPFFVRPIAALFLAASFAIAPASLAQQAPQPELPRIPLSIGMYVVQAEVANTFATRATGLMARRTMAANHGMLFVFPTAEPICMWMRNTLLPLSVAFIDDAGVITNIEDMEPLTENSHCAVRAARYALEMNKGWFATKGLKAGVKVGGLDKAPAAR